MEQRAITQMEKSPKMTKAEEKLRQAQAVYDQAVKDEKERIRKIQNRHKYMMGGCVLKYFPEEYNAYEFDEPEMNRIIACAFSLKDVNNMIKTVVKDRPTEEQEVEETHDENETVETGCSLCENETAEAEEKAVEEIEENEGEES